MICLSDWRVVGPYTRFVTSLLGPISRRRFGQNQRSIFGFLNSTEPQGFQDFLRSAQDDPLYPPDLLWDYLRFNLEPSIMASPDGHRWALAVDALERCQTLAADELHLTPSQDYCVDRYVQGKVRVGCECRRTQVGAARVWRWGSQECARNVAGVVIAHLSQIQRFLQCLRRQ